MLSRYTPAAEAAMRAATPLLRVAADVSLVEVDDGSVQLPAEQAAEYLSRNGVKPMIRREAARTDVAGNGDSRRAAIVSRRLAVMGGFGHGRLVEAAFGGFTWRLFRDADVPLLLAH